MNSSEEKGNNRQKSENSIIDESTDRVEKIDSEKDDYVGKKLIWKRSQGNSPFNTTVLIEFNRSFWKLKFCEND